MVSALSGAVIVKIDGNLLTYRQKCDKCGTLGALSPTIQKPTGRATHQNYFRCFNCGNNQDIRIYGE
jgi:hypothetical protein